MFADINVENISSCFKIDTMVSVIKSLTEQVAQSSTVKIQGELTKNDILYKVETVAYVV